MKDNDLRGEKGPLRRGGVGKDSEFGGQAK